MTRVRGPATRAQDQAADGPARSCRRSRRGGDLKATQALDAASEILASLRARHGISDLARLVAGVPGPLDTRTGLVCSPPVVSGWVPLAPAEGLERQVGIPVQAEDEAFLGTYGECRRGGRPRLRGLPLHQGLARHRRQPGDRRQALPWRDRPRRRDRPHPPRRPHRTLPGVATAAASRQSSGSTRSASRPPTPTPAPRPIGST